ncbi:hypothetical protein NW752_005337 [Fusarium irregulare]|uniref:DUF6604 domain-containing protein n=1 Tax=Fusarium irregulare TaxID=2494466 RepID=A0A9W8PZ38_9HYPO|nr:hypothetical protein NW752_005337 [Fusarium irregulare]KAJ4023837.1 hypothetical protein NW766_000061 [Fusarium irregulare]
MLPDALMKGLRQYKSDTNALAAWLASTSRLCGYKCDFPNQKSFPDGENPPSGRLKGKARKEAKKRGAPVNPANPQTTKSQGPKYTVALKDFLPMAECIAKSRKPLITVPSSFVSTIDRAIRLRSNFAAERALHGMEVDIDADNAHDYFVGVLNKVKEALRPRFPPTQNAQTTQPPEKEDISRGFQALSFEEPSQEFLNAPDVKLPQKAQGDDTSYKAKKDQENRLWEILHAPDILELPQKVQGDITDYKAEDDEEEETGFTNLISALVLLEAKAMRDQIQWIWQGCLDKTIDITAAAVATNVGIQRIRKLSEECSMSNENNALRAAQLHFSTNAYWKGAMSGRSFREMAKGAEDLREKVDRGMCPNDLFEDYSNSFLYAIHTIKPLVEQTQDSLPYFRPRKVENPTAREQFLLEERDALYDFWVEGVLFLHYNIEKAGSNHFPVEDEFLRILRKTNETNEVSFELAFVAQVFLDIRHLLGSTETMAEKAIGCIGGMKLGLDTFVELWADSPSAKGRDSLKSQLKEGQDCLNNMIRDVIPAVKAYQIRNGLDVEGVDEPWRFLKRSPVLCGLALFHARVEIYNLSINCMKETGVTTRLVHLYNAIQQEGFLDKSWADMEEFEACFEEEDLFMGRKPTRSSQYNERLMVQMGCSFSSIQKLKRSSWRQQVTDKHQKGLAFRTAIQGMDKGAPVSKTYLRMHKQRGGCLDLTKKEVVDIVSLSKYKLVQESDRYTFGSLSKEEKQQLNKRASQPKSKHQSGKDAWPESYYLVLLTMALAAEARELAFPHLQMHDFCFGLQAEIFDRCKPVIEEKVLYKGVVPLRGPIDIIPRTLQLVEWPKGDQVLKEAASVIAEFCDDFGDKIQGLIREIKSYSEPVVVTSVASGTCLKRYSELVD